MDVHLRSAVHPLLGRLRIGAPRLWPLSPELHTSDCSSACPGSSTWVDKVPSRDTPSLNLADRRGGVAPDNPQVALRRAARRPGGGPQRAAKGGPAALAGSFLTLHIDPGRLLAFAKALIGHGFPQLWHPPLARGKRDYRKVERAGAG